MILIYYYYFLGELKDTLKPPQNEVMKKMALYAIGGTTLFYISLLTCMAYAAIGNSVLGNVLGGFNHPFLLTDITNWFKFSDDMKFLTFWRFTSYVAINKMNG